MRGAATADADGHHTLCPDLCWAVGVGHACLVKTVRPSKNGGFVSCTIRITRTSSSFVKSVSTCAAQHVG